MAYLILIAIAIHASGLISEYFLVKTGRIVNQESYSLEDIIALKKKGYIYFFAAQKRLAKVPEMSNIGYKARILKFGEL